jgi:hypothetical protein
MGTQCGMPSAVVAEVHDRLNRIATLAKEIESVPNLLPDLWTMKGIDKKCQEIQANANHILQAMNRYIGTGVG